MKKILLLLLLLLLNSSLVYATNWCNDANIGGCWPTELGSGTTLDDNSSNSNDGTFEGSGEPAWDNGNIPGGGDGFNGTTNYSVDYDGNDDEIVVSDANSLDATNNLSIVTWIYMDDSGGQVITKDNSGSNNRSYGIYFNSSTFCMSAFKAGDSESLKCGGTAVSAIDFEWHHFAGIYTFVSDGNSIIEVFIDGVSDGSMSSAVGPLQVTTTDVRLGSREYSGFEDWIDVNLDESAIFLSSLDSTDINNIMDNGLVPSSARRTMIIQ